MPIAYTPAVQRRLSTAVIAKFEGAFNNVRASDLLAICGTQPAGGFREVVALIVGKNLSLQRRGAKEDTIDWREPNVYAHGSETAEFITGISISNIDAKADRIDKLLAIASTAGAAAAELPSRMIEAMIPLALEQASYDGEAFYSDSHLVVPGGPATFANTDNLGALDLAAYDEAVTQFAQMPDEDGRACNSKPSVLFYGSDYREVARDILTNRVPLASAGGENMRVGDGVRGIEVADWPSTFWGLADLRSSERAFHYAEFEPFRVVPWITDPNSPEAIVRNGLRWIVQGRAAMVLGDFRKTFLSVNPSDVAAIVAAAKAKLELNKFLTDVN